MPEAFFDGGHSGSSRSLTLREAKGGTHQWGFHNKDSPTQRVPALNILKILVPKTIPCMAFGTRVLKHWVLGPSGQGFPEFPKAPEVWGPLPRSPLGSRTTLGLQIAQSRSYLYTLGPEVGIIHILGALGLCLCLGCCKC